VHGAEHTTVHGPAAGASSHQWQKTGQRPCAQPTVVESRTGIGDAVATMDAVKAQKGDPTPLIRIKRAAVTSDEHPFPRPPMPGYLIITKQDSCKRGAARMEATHSRMPLNLFQFI
jgi:hypothetical protein